MNPKKDISEELDNLAPALKGLNKAPLGEVPEGYFETFPLEMLGKVSTFSHEVPQGYFEAFPGKLMDQVMSSSDERSQILEGIGRENVMTVPYGYFDELPAIIVSRVNTPAKVVSMNFRSVARYAVAAVVTGIIGLGIFNYSGKSDSFDKQYAAIVKEGLNIARNSEFDAVLQTVSDNEIEAYLSETGMDVDAALVAAASMEETKLPEAEDLLLDEKTLDDYLNELNINDLN